MSERQAPVFPPLFHGQGVRADPFARACDQARQGCESGLVVHNITADALCAAMVLAPEVPLEAAMAAMIACGIGFQNALGALAPPEVAVHLTWEGGIRVNGARCGRLRAAASTTDPADLPDWLVIGINVPLIPASDAPGETPDETCLFEEGCADVEPVALLEAWVRHSLVWINTLLEAGSAPLHAEWLGLVQEVGTPVAPELAGVHHRGTFVGIDEHFGMVLRDAEATHLLPLSGVLEPGGAQ